jgi:integrase
MSEVRVMRWTDVEWSTRLWKKPRTKNGTSQFVPLPVQAVDALTRLPRTSDWVFPGDKGNPWSPCNPQKLWGAIRRRWQMEDVTIHDLRRTCASYLAISGENLPTIQTVLNHKNLAHTAIYARLNTKAVDRALQAQADRLCGLVQGPVVLPALTHDFTPTVKGGERPWA